MQKRKIVSQSGFLSVPRGFSHVQQKDPDLEESNNNDESEEAPEKAVEPVEEVETNENVQTTVEQVEFVCKLCSLPHSKFNWHMRTAHPGCSIDGVEISRSLVVDFINEFLLSACEKSFVCKECSKSFSQAEDLKKHMKTHSGESTTQPTGRLECLG